MRRLHYIIIAALFILAGCSSSKDYLSRGDDDKTLFDAIKALSKKNSDTAAARAIPVLYNAARERHLAKIRNYTNSNNLSRWEKIIDEYSTLLKMQEAISQSPAAPAMVQTENFRDSLEISKQSAAADYYQAGMEKLYQGQRSTAKEAYNYFKKADKIIPSYRDAKAKMTEAYQSAIVLVQINPITDNSFYYQNNWSSFNNNYNNLQFQLNLVRELGAADASRYPARFYTEDQALQQNIAPQLLVNITLRNIDMPYPSKQYYTRRSSAQVMVGQDTSGRTIYETVYAQVNITRESFTSRIEMALEVTEADTRKSVTNRTYYEDYSWQEESATYSGDQRALSDSDWSLVNNSRYNQPRQDEVMRELYRRIYPRVRDGISSAVNW